MPILSSHRSALLFPSPDLFAPSGPAPFVPQTQSIDFDGSTEFMESALVTLGISTPFTVAGWVKINNVATVSGTLFGWEPDAGSSNFLRIFHRHAGPTGPLAIQVWMSDSVPVTNLNVSWQGITVAGAWAHVVFQWDGTAANKKLWFNGVDQGAHDFSSGAPVDGSQTDTARRLTFASAMGGVGNLAGRGASLALWSSFLGALEVPAIYNAGSINFDLQTNQGNYASSGSLVHWHEAGKRADPDIGIDSVGTALDLMDAASNISDADRVADVP